jgi:hypothetical protein
MTSTVASILGEIDRLSTAERQELMIELLQRDTDFSIPLMDSLFKGLDQTTAKSLLIEKLQSGLKQVNGGQVIDGETAFDLLESMVKKY